MSANLRCSSLQPRRIAPPRPFLRVVVSPPVCRALKLTLALAAGLFWLFGVSDTCAQMLNPRLELATKTSASAGDAEYGYDQPADLTIEGKANIERLFSSRPEKVRFTLEIPGETTISQSAPVAYTGP